MLRALFEMVATIFVVIVARAILNSVFRGFSGAAGAAVQHKPAPGESVASPPTKRDLHKDPVCGTYVPDTTAFQRQSGSQTFYYCSAGCRQKHALVTQ